MALFIWNLAGILVSIESTNPWKFHTMPWENKMLEAEMVGTEKYNFKIRWVFFFPWAKQGLEYIEMTFSGKIGIRGTPLVVGGTTVLFDVASAWEIPWNIHWEWIEQLLCLGEKKKGQTGKRLQSFTHLPGTKPTDHRWTYVWVNIHGIVLKTIISFFVELQNRAWF